MKHEEVVLDRCCIKRAYHVKRKCFVS